MQAQIDTLVSENATLQEQLTAKEDASSELPQETEPNEVSTPETDPAPETSDAAGEYGRKNPAPIGTSQTITVEGWDDTYTVTLTVNWVNRGEDVWYYIQQANRYNEAPSSGIEYIIANITATVEDSQNDLAVDFSGFDFDVFLETSSEYDDRVPVVEPEPAFSGEAYSGASVTGNVVFMVDATDTAPKITYSRDYNGSGGIWMALYY